MSDEANEQPEPEEHLKSYEVTIYVDEPDLGETPDLVEADMIQMGWRVRSVSRTVTGETKYVLQKAVPLSAYEIMHRAAVLAHAFLKDQMGRVAHAGIMAEEVEELMRAAQTLKAQEEKD